MHRRNCVLRVTVLLAVLMLTTRINAQVDQGQLAERLLSEDAAERRNALTAVSAIEADNMSVELREALITALERENDIASERYEAGRRGETLEPLEDPEAYLAFVPLVTRLRTPEAIPALVGALRTGLMSAQALAEFGEQAVPAVLNVVRSPENRSPAQVRNAVTALRYMIEDPTTVLTLGTLEEIRRVTGQLLTGEQNLTVLERAIDLAVVLGDPSLRQIVESIASDRNQLVARGIEEPERIERIQQRAAEGLRGNPPSLPQF
jgi:hypothetical protein